MHTHNKKHSDIYKHSDVTRLRETQKNTCAKRAIIIVARTLARSTAQIVSTRTLRGKREVGLKLINVYISR